jgi:hypothetical protein
MHKIVVPLQLIVFLLPWLSIVGIGLESLEIMRVLVQVGHQHTYFPKFHSGVGDRFLNLYERWSVTIK